MREKSFTSPNYAELLNDFFFYQSKLTVSVNGGSRGIAPTFLKLDSRSPGAGFIPIISTKGINLIKKGKLLVKS